MNYIDLEAMKRAENDTDWMVYFKALARHYVRSFSINYSKLKNLAEKVKEENQDFDCEIIKEKLLAYFKLYLALSPQKYGELNVNKEMLFKFYKINDEEKIKKHKAAFVSLNLDECEISGSPFTLDQIMAIVISFFQDRTIRYEFFKNLLSNKDMPSDNMNLHEILPRKAVELQSINA